MLFAEVVRSLTICLAWNYAYQVYTDNFYMTLYPIYKNDT